MQTTCMCQDTAHISHSRDSHHTLSHMLHVPHQAALGSGQPNATVRNIHPAESQRRRLWLVTAVQVVCQMAPMLSKHLLSVTPVVAQVWGGLGHGFQNSVQDC